MPLWRHHRPLRIFFSLLQVNGSEVRIVKQFQFTAWPDPEVPSNPGPLLAFIRRVRKENTAAAAVGPMIVHCRYAFSCSQWCGKGGAEPPSCDLWGRSPLNSVNCLEIRAFKNHYSVVEGYFRFKKLRIHRYFARYRIVEPRCLLDGIIIFLYKYAD